MAIPILGIGLGILGASILYKAVKVASSNSKEKEEIGELFRKRYLTLVDDIKTSKLSKKEKKVSYKNLILALEQEIEELKPHLLYDELQELKTNKEEILLKFKNSERSVVLLIELYLQIFNKLP